MPTMLSVFNILIHELYRKFDKNCIKTLKVEKFCKFCHFWVIFIQKTAFIFTSIFIGQRIRAFLNVFNNLIHDVYRKNDKNCIKTSLKTGKFLNFCHFRGHFGSLWVHFRHSQKSPKISTNTYRTKLNSRELNSMGNAFKVNIKFVLGKFCKKKPFDLNIYLSHMKHGRKIKSEDNVTNINATNYSEIS